MKALHCPFNIKLKRQAVNTNFSGLVLLMEIEPNATVSRANAIYALEWTRSLISVKLFLINILT